MKYLILFGWLFVSTAIFAEGIKLPAVTKEGKEPRVGGCKVHVSSGASSTGGVKEIRIYTKDDYSERGAQYASFKFDEKLGMPVHGFNTCSGDDYGPVVIEKQKVGELTRFKFFCGGTFKPVKGQAEIVLNEKTRAVEHVEVNLKGAYTNPLLSKTPKLIPSFLVHSGPVKYELENLSCSTPRYEEEKFVIADAITTLGKHDKNGPQGSVEYGVVERAKYMKAESRQAAQEMSDKLWDERAKAAK